MEDKMNITMRILIYCLTIALLAVPCIASEPGASKSKPNVSGGYDFYDAAGVKTSSSSKRPDGGYDYFDKHGNLTGSLVQNEDTDAYEYRDADNIDRGTLTSDPYGGYRFKTKGDDTVTAEQANIRRNYDYANPYGDGIKTLSPDVIRGLDKTDQPLTENTGLGTTSRSENALSDSSTQTEAYSSADTGDGLSVVNAD